MPITQTIDASVLTLSLELGRGNAIDDAFIEALHRALDGALSADVRALVLTGQGRTFCAGLNLVAIADLDREALGRFVDAFDRMFERVFAFPKPVIAAINGHALAGGCVLAMAADHRIMAPGEHVIGVNEVMLGISFPAAAFEIARSALPTTVEREALLEGRRYSPEEALRAGIVHEIAGSDGVVAAAQAKARRMAAVAPHAFEDTKADLLAPVLARIEAARAARRQRFLDRWFLPEARARVGRLRDELQGRRGGAR